MPLPLLIIGAAAVAGLFGVGAAASGISNMSDANDKRKRANERREDNRRRLKQSTELTQKNMADLGRLKVEIGQNFRVFADTFGKIKNLPDSAGIADASGGRASASATVKYGDMDLSAIRAEADEADAVLAGVGALSAGAVAGGVTAATVFAATAAFGTATTGTAIASLSGVCATNATMAALGGGALAAGGGGMALGMAALGGATLGAGLLIGGIALAIFGENASEKADEDMKQAEEEEKKIDEFCGYLARVSDVANRYKEALAKVYDAYRKCVRGLIFIVTDFNRTDWNEYSEGERRIVTKTAVLIELLRKMLRVPLLNRAEAERDMNTINGGEITLTIDVSEVTLDRLGLSAQGTPEE